MERVLLGYPAGTACEHMHVHPFIVVCRLDKRKRHLATTCDADNSRSNRARRSLSKHGIPPSADVLRRECKGRQSKSNSWDANPKATVANAVALLAATRLLRIFLLSRRGVESFIETT